MLIHHNIINKVILNGGVHNSKWPPTHIMQNYSISAYPMEGRGHSRKSVSAHLDHSPTHKGTVLVCINVHWRELKPGDRDVCVMRTRT